MLIKIMLYNYYKWYNCQDFISSILNITYVRSLGLFPHLINQLSFIKPFICVRTISRCIIEIIIRIQCIGNGFYSTPYLLVFQIREKKFLLVKWAGCIFKSRFYNLTIQQYLCRLCFIPPISRMTLAFGDILPKIAYSSILNHPNHLT